MSFNGKSITVFAHDYETTGVVVHQLGVVQAALCIATLHQDGSYEILEKDVQNLNPGVAIEPGATAIHGLSDFDVADCPEWFEYLSEQMQTVNEYGVDAVVSFNGNRFDNKIAMRAGWKPLVSIDLYKYAAMLKKEKLWEAANLGYSYEKVTGKALEKAHDAFADIIGTLDMIKPMVALSGLGSLDAFHRHIQGDDGTPEMKINFGTKHKGKKIKHVPLDYLEWLLSAKCEMTHSVEFEMAVRAALGKPVAPGAK